MPADLTDEQKAAVSERLAAAEDPGWYLNVLGEAFLETDDFDQALRVADAAYAEQPAEEPDEEDELLATLADVVDDGGAMGYEEGGEGEQ